MAGRILAEVQIWHQKVGMKPIYYEIIYIQAFGILVAVLQLVSSVLFK